MLTARILEAIEETVRLAREIARRAEARSSVAPMLRAKGSEAAVEMLIDDIQAELTGRRYELA